MKNIVFFCRSRLTQLYGELYQHLAGDLNCKYIAYSHEDEFMLENIYKIKAESNFKDFIHKHHGRYEELLIEEIDLFIAKWSNERFNVNSVIQSDRALCHLELQDAYSMLKVYYVFWKRFFEQNQDIDVFFHETTSLALNFIASLFCLKTGAIYTDMVGVPNSVPSFMFISSSIGESKDFELKLSVTSEVKAEFENYINLRYQSIANLSTDTSIVKSFKAVIKNKIFQMLNRFNKKIDKVKDCVEWFMLYDERYINKIKNLFFYNAIKWDEPNPSELFYYYSMNLEPEAVIQYIADGYYSNQIKLIENIAAQLPPNSYLYVKDHVVEYGYRSYKDYKYLQSLHNVKVINPRVRGSTLIKSCKAVVSICGTAVLEAHFFNKCSYMFGNFYYTKSKNVFKIQNVKDFRQQVYSDPTFDFDDKETFIGHFLGALHLGSPDYFTGGTSAGADGEHFSENVLNISKAIKKYVATHCAKEC